MKMYTNPVSNTKVKKRGDNMKLKKTIFSTLTFVLLITAAGTVFADGPQGAVSDVNVTFIADEPTKPVDPLDPTDPTKPLEPKEDGTGNTGLLTLDYVPKFTFETQKIDRKPVSINSTNMKPFVQVTDVRATGAGWNLQGSLGELIHESGNHTLKNAQIVMKNPVVKTAETNALNAPASAQEIVLTSGPNNTPVDIFTASEEHGMGTWLSTWLPTSGAKSNENITLNLDTRDARVGGYHSTITWSLIQTP